MSLQVFVFCDRCSLDSTVSKKIARAEGRGWCAVGRVYAKHLGWIRKGGKDICPECQDEKEAK